MGLVGLLLVLLLPVAVGTIFVRRLLGEAAGPAPWVISLGFGYFIGVLSAAGLIGLQGRWGFGLSPWPLMLVMALGLALALWRFPTRLRPTFVIPPASKPERIVFAILLLWIVARLGLLGFESLRQPLLTWDAWTTWFLRAKVWVELGEWVPFVAPEVWLSGTISNAHTTPAWNYPPLVSWIGALPAIGFGEWSDNIAGLPWFGCGVALGLGVYGSLRVLGYGVVIALAPVALILTLPLLDSHIALSGLADIWITATLALAFCAFLLAARSNDFRYVLLVASMLLFCILAKREGIVWAALVIPAVLAVRSQRWMLAVTCVGLLGLLVVAMIGEVRLPLVGTFQFAYQGSWRSLLVQTLSFGSWHVLIPGFVATLVLAVKSHRSWSIDRSMRGAAVWVGGSVLLLYFLFFWTDAAAWAELGTAVSRLILHFAAVWVLWMLLIWVPPQKRLC
jgi:hypothetical protein